MKLHYALLHNNAFWMKSCCFVELFFFLDKHLHSYVLFMGTSFYKVV